MRWSEHNRDVTLTALAHGFLSSALTLLVFVTYRLTTRIPNAPFSPWALFLMLILPAVVCAGCGWGWMRLKDVEPDDGLLTFAGSTHPVGASLGDSGAEVVGLETEGTVSAQQLAADIQEAQDVRKRQEEYALAHLDMWGGTPGK